MMYVPQNSSKYWSKAMELVSVAVTCLLPSESNKTITSQCMNPLTASATPCHPYNRNISLGFDEQL